ncbi:MAG: sodium/proton-translocating pyrophosphatase [bacterium]|nr:sodium/proton-translocating pyrophosphatase [bacterium]
MFSYLPLIVAVIVGLAGLEMLRQVHRLDFLKGKASELSELVSDGLSAFTKRALSIVGQVILYFALLILLVLILVGRPINWAQLLAFVIGALVMAGTSLFYLKLIPMLVPRIVTRSSGFIYDSIRLLYKSSMSIALIVIGGLMLSMIGVYTILGLPCLVGFALGIMVASFFLRIGGGVFKASSKINATLVSQLEETVPADHRNPATILDLIGGYIGEMVGFSADIISSYIIAILAALVATFTLFYKGVLNVESSSLMIEMPLLIVTLSLGSALLSYIYGRVRVRYHHQNLLLETIYLSLIVNGIGTYFLASRLSFPGFSGGLVSMSSQFQPFLPYIIGVVWAVIIALSTERFTNHKFKPAREVARQTEFGPAIVQMHSWSNSLHSHAIFLVVLGLVAFGAYYFAGIYGMAISALGMLSSIICVVGAKVFVSLAQNMNKTAALVDTESSILCQNARRIDELGHTISPLGNGFATAAATLSSASLIVSILAFSQFNGGSSDLGWAVGIGVLAGIILATYFLATLQKGLLKCIISAVREATRQFREIPYLMEGKARPDIIKASNLHTIESLRALTVPGLLVVLVPLVLGVLGGGKIIFGLILGVFLVALALGYAWSNFGDLLFNARRFVESGHFGGKQSKTYRNVLSADNFGTGLGEVMGPATNILIKSTSIMVILIVYILI